MLSSLDGNLVGDQMSLTVEHQALITEPFNLHPVVKKRSHVEMQGPCGPRLQLEINIIASPDNLRF